MINFQGRKLNLIFSEAELNQSLIKVLSPTATSFQGMSFECEIFSCCQDDLELERRKII